MNIIDFANPVGWWGAFLAIPVILLYVLKLRLRRQTVSTFLFWQQLYDEKKPRAWWQRLRHILSLLLQLAFLGLLVSALVDPLWAWQRRRERTVVLVVDNSASMRAVGSDGVSRLESAKQSAASIVRSLRGGDRMAILSAGGQPDVVIGMTDHQRSLLRAIRQLPATDGPTDIVAAVKVAEGLVHESEGRRKPEIVVLSDGCFDEFKSLTENESVAMLGVGSPQDNMGITRFQVRRNLLDATTFQVLIDVANFSESDASCRIELMLEEDLVDVIPVEIESGKTVTRIVDHTSIAGGRLTATIDSEDALVTDNVAVAVLPRREKLPVTLVTQGNLYIENVIRSIESVDLSVVEKTPLSVPAGGLLVIDQDVPATLPQGRVIVVDPLSDTDLWERGEEIAQPIVAWVDADSELTRHVRLDNVLLPGSRSLNFKVPALPLIKDPLDQAMMARLRRRAGDVIVLTGSLEKGDLPLRIAFPVLMKNTIEWFQGNSGELHPTIGAGGVLAVDVSGAEAVGVRMAASSDAANASEKDSDASGESAAGTDGKSVASAESASDEQAETDASEAALEDGELAIVSAAQPRSTREWRLVSPSGEQTPIATTNQQASIGPLLETGVWLVRPATATAAEALNVATQESREFVDPRNIPIACNLANPAESDLRSRMEMDNAVGSQQPMLGGFGGYSLWFYLTLLAAMLVTTEWWLYQRRIVG